MFFECLSIVKHNSVLFFHSNEKKGYFSHKIAHRLLNMWFCFIFWTVEHCMMAKRTKSFVILSVNGVHIEFRLVPFGRYEFSSNKIFTCLPNRLHWLQPSTEVLCERNYSTLTIWLKVFYLLQRTKKINENNLLTRARFEISCFANSRNQDTRYIIYVWQR